MVERRNRGDHTDWLPRGESPATIARRREPHRDLSAGEVADFLGRGAQTVDGTDSFDLRVRQRLSTLLCDEPRKRVKPLPQQPGGADQDRAPLVCFQGAIAILREPDCRFQLGLERGGVVGRELGDQGSVISLNDLIGVRSD